MPRQSRIDAPGALHHVMIRGIERRAIFRDNHDRDAFLDRFGAILLESSTSCFAWSLLNNHAHLLLRTGTVPVSRVMRRLLTGYAVSFNLRHRRHGHLFQNRYKSILCEEESYLLELVRYIHLNPLRAGLVKDLEELGTYAYSGHSSLMNSHKRAWQDGAYVLRRFGQREGESRRRYLDFVLKGIEVGRRPDLVGGGLLRSVGGWKGVLDLRDSGEKALADERILGGTEFVERAFRVSNEAYEKRSRRKAQGIGLERLMEGISTRFGVDVSDLRTASKVSAVAKARALLCYVGVRELGLTAVSIARELGISPSTVSRAILRGHRTLKAKEIEKLLECQ